MVLVPTILTVKVPSCLSCVDESHTLFLLQRSGSVFGNNLDPYVEGVIPHPTCPLEKVSEGATMGGEGKTGWVRLFDLPTATVETPRGERLWSQTV